MSTTTILLGLGGILLLIGSFLPAIVMSPLMCGPPEGCGLHLGYSWLQLDSSDFRAFGLQAPLVPYGAPLVAVALLALFDLFAPLLPARLRRLANVTLAAAVIAAIAYAIFWLWQVDHYWTHSLPNVYGFLSFGPGFYLVLIGATIGATGAVLAARPSLIGRSP